MLMVSQPPHRPKFHNLRVIIDYALNLQSYIKTHQNHLLSPQENLQTLIFYRMVEGINSSLLTNVTYSNPFLGFQQSPG